MDEWHLRVEVQAIELPCEVVNLTQTLISFRDLTSVPNAQHLSMANGDWVRLHKHTLNRFQWAEVKGQNLFIYNVELSKVIHV